MSTTLVSTRPPSAPRPFLRWVVIAGIVVAVIGGYSFYESVLNRPTADVYVVRRGTAVAAVYGTVTIASKQVIVINAQTGGILKMSPGIRTIVDASGLVVRQNDLIATIPDDGAQRALAQARTDYEAALSHHKLGPGSRQSLKIARDQLRVYDGLPANSVPRMQRESTRDEVVHLEMAVNNETLELQRTLDTTTGVLKSAEENIKRTEVRAPISGVILTPSFNDGAYVPAGAALFSVASKELYIAGQVNEEDVGKLRPGMKAEMHLYAYGNDPFVATLAAVQPNPDPNSSRYTVTLYMDRPPDNLMFGLTGEMNIILGRRENSLVVPARALLVDQVLCVQDGTISQRTVKTGFKSLEFAEVTEGLRDGDLVVVNDQDAFRNDERVRPLVVNGSAAGRKK